MDDTDDATIDAILALQLEDLAGIWKDRDGDGSDRTDTDAAIDFQRHELQRATARFQDHRSAAAIGESNSDVDEDEAKNDEDGGQDDGCDKPDDDDKSNSNDQDDDSTTDDDDDDDDDDDTDKIGDPQQTPTDRGTSQAPNALQLNPSCNVCKAEVISDSRSDDSFTISQDTLGDNAREKDLLRDSQKPSINEFGGVHALTYAELEKQQAEDNDRAAICIICRDDSISSEAVRMRCGHQHCTDCVKLCFDLAMKDKNLFPPQCCSEPIAFTEVQSFFSENFRKEFEERQVELSTSNRTYCSNEECSSFIAPSAIEDGKATCPKCYSETCALCKGELHGAGDCPQDPAVVSLMAMAFTEGWKQCSECHNMVELTYGCNHMVCICKAEFCYACGSPWKTCRCDNFDEDRLLNRDEAVPDAGRLPNWILLAEEIPEVDDRNQAAPEVPVANARILPAHEVPEVNDRDQTAPNIPVVDNGNLGATGLPELSSRVNRIDRLALQRGRTIFCRHRHFWSSETQGNLTCETCGERRGGTILECPGCRLRNCWNCRIARYRWYLLSRF
ncbi:MAG: hypothetical protein Q9170_002238 [Blastenia crenularia]